MERSKLSIEKQIKDKKKVIKGSPLVIDDMSHTKELGAHGGSVLGRCFTTARQLLQVRTPRIARGAGQAAN